MSKTQECTNDAVIAALIDKTLEAGAAVTSGAYPKVVEHLKVCSECRTAAVDLLAILWMEALGILEEPPREGEFDFSFLSREVGKTCNPS